MPRIITALFENHAQAQRALQAMMEAGVTRDRISLVGRDAGSEVSSISGFRELSARDDTLVELHDLPLPEEDLREFERGLEGLLPALGADRAARTSTKRSRRSRCSIRSTSIARAGNGSRRISAVEAEAAWISAARSVRV